MTFAIKLPLFEGPFDLLLFFIERDELNIHDIPISRVTRDFLAYLRHLETLNVEVASEFILVAATLMRIKAKMLLPRMERDTLGFELDPRDELVRHLLEYRRYKSVLPELMRLEETRASQHARGNLLAELQAIGAGRDAEAELQDLDLYRLLRTFERVMRRQQQAAQRPTHTVMQYPYTIEAQKARLLHWLQSVPRLSFEAVIASDAQKIVVVYNFLAILELLQLGTITLQTGEGFNNFWLAARQPEPAGVDA